MCLNIHIIAANETLVLTQHVQQLHPFQLKERPSPPLTVFNLPASTQVEQVQERARHHPAHIPSMSLYAVFMCTLSCMLMSIVKLHQSSCAPTPAIVAVPAWWTGLPSA